MKDVVTDIDDLKEYKKLLRTRTNVLVMFGKTGMISSGATRDVAFTSGLHSLVQRLLLNGWDSVLFQLRT